MKAIKAPLIVVVTALLTACASNPRDLDASVGLLQIQEQGSFAAGGTMTTATGSFTPCKPGLESSIAPKRRKYHFAAMLQGAFTKAALRLLQSFSFPLVVA